MAEMASDSSMPIAAFRRVDAAAEPHWLRTGFKFFPYAAKHGGRWWVLRRNFRGADYDAFTLFIDASPAADITGSATHSSALVRSIAALQPHDCTASEPALDTATATAVITPVAGYADYGSQTE